jgi:hypothetical protein
MIHLHSAVLNWVRQHCASKVDLVFKVDDDVYVNVHNLVHFVRSNYQSNSSLFGYGVIYTGLHTQSECNWDITL